MNNLNLIRGLFLMAIALAFGLGSLKYTIGEFSRAGPGLFPLLVSSLVFLIGVITLVRARFVKGLCGFAVLSQYLNMIAGILFLVFCASFAGTSYSVVRNLKISAGLIGVALVFRHLLGLQLPLF
jgi:hypothetical protein